MRVFVWSLIGLVLLGTGPVRADDAFERTVHCEKNAGTGGAHWVVDLLDDVGNGAYIARVSRNGSPLYGPSIRPIILYREGRRSTWKSAQQTVGLSVDSNGLGFFYTQFYRYEVSNLQCTGGGGGSGNNREVLESTRVSPSKPGPRLKCTLADEGNHDPKTVAYGVTDGFFVSPVPVVHEGSHEIRVIWNQGSTFDSQTSLSMDVDGTASRIFNLDPKAIYMQTGADYILSCAFEK